MSAKLPPDEFEDALFLAMLELSRTGAGPEFDLVEVCRSKNLAADAPDMSRFANDNDGLRGQKISTFQSFRFILNAEGRRHALQLERSKKPRTVRDRLADIPIGKGLWDLVKIGLGALLGVLVTKYSGIF